MGDLAAEQGCNAISIADGIVFWHAAAVNMVQVQDNLRHILNEWDPIGVADLVEDECMVAPLLSRLGGGAGRAAISEFLWGELEEHFGLDPAFHDVDALADRLVAWWAAVGPSTDLTE